MKVEKSCCKKNENLGKKKRKLKKLKNEWKIKMFWKFLNFFKNFMKSIK